MSKFADTKKRHYYAVTNSHVVQGRNSVIRINRKDGTVATIPTEKSLWTYSDSADLAVLPIELDDAYDVKAFNTDMLLTKFKLGTKGLGIGDETFMIGRFINHEGRQRNKPKARFGTVAMMPDASEGVYNHHMSQRQEAYLVETHTVCGYSGSPVFFFIPAMSKRPPEDKANNPLAWRGPWLLGVEWAHIIDHEPVVEKGVEGEWKKTGQYVEVTTGMMCVSPAWHLEALLNDPHLAQLRDEQEAKWEKESKPRVVAKLDSAHQPAPAGDLLLDALLKTPPAPKTKVKATSKRKA
ncbi:MAG: trypsin-like peptidase domain-containing protein [Betaproteobacteria bacterium]|nr:trypsin-like peptidase domain-containing protein [Betaproteobacteria bacterium]